eukprot:g7848.t1
MSSTAGVERGIKNLALEEQGVKPSQGGGAPSSGGQPAKASFTYNAERVLGSGSFGIVYQAQVVETNETVAIKKVFQDKRYKNRELQIMKELKHPNIVELKHAFYTSGDKPGETYLNVVMEYCSDTVYRVMKHYNKMKQPMPIIFVKLYICSRYYRAPELIFGATDYTTAIDIWSAACVTAEMILGQPLFPGESGVDQLVEIIKVLGTPTREQLMAMNPNYTEFKFPSIKPHPWSKVFRQRTSPDAIDFVSKLLQYDPKVRPHGLEAILHEFFDELRDQQTKLSSSKPMPELFDFSKEELQMMQELASEATAKLLPQWVRDRKK